MAIIDKLKILAGSAKYDVSCASSGATGRANKSAINIAGCCHSWSADGRCISLLKVLFTNHCIYDCRYCANRSSNDVPRASFTPEELAYLTQEFYQKNYVEGLFLSSAVVKNADHTMGLILKAVRLLRFQYQFKGYIHIKVIPGSSQVLVDEAAQLADRLSVNVEFASSESLCQMAPQKDWGSVMRPMARARDLIAQNLDDRKKKVRGRSPFAATGQSTQLIVGATPEKDGRILRLAHSLYDQEKLKRVYYSAYVPVNANSDAPKQRPPLLREHRLYQADWLLRFYGFAVDEVSPAEEEDLDLEFDPKTSWALRHPEKFPIEVNSASYEALLRIPGIGVRGAQKIIHVRQSHKLKVHDLKTLNLTLKKARYFLTASGRYASDLSYDMSRIKQRLSRGTVEKQFTFLDPSSTREEQWSAVTGEL